MFKTNFESLLVFSLFISLSRTGNTGYSAGSSFPSFPSAFGSGNYGNSGTGSGNSGPVQAAIETHRTVEVRPVNIPSDPAQPQVIEVGSEDLPVTVHFKSHSSSVRVQQTHIPGVPGETEHTSSEDEPHRVVHEVVKPVIQEVREIIQPYRRLVQQIQPVIEQTHTIVAKGEPKSPQNSFGPQTQSSSSSGYSSSAYSSRSGTILPPEPKGQNVVSIDSTGSGSSRIYSSVKREKNFRKARARA